MAGLVWRSVGVMLAVTAMVAGAAATSAAQAPDPPVVARMRAYLADYEPRLSALVADESFEQELRGSSVRYDPIDGAASVVDQSANRRLLQSEIGFLRLPGELGWLAQRQVVAVNGQPVNPSTPHLAEAFVTAGPGRLALAQRIAEANARYNLGNPRSINVPTLPLDLIGSRHAARFAVSVGGESRLNGRTVREIRLHEHLPGRLVAYGDGKFMRARVRVWVVEATGEIVRAAVALDLPIPRVPDHQLDVDFARHEQVLVPVRMIERFGARGEGRGEASYRNYRRFATAGRIVP